MAAPAPPAPPSVSSATWCSQVLALLREQFRPANELPYREMLLTYLIDLDPAPASFEALLARFAADECQGVAGAARLLQDAWARVQDDTTEWQLEFPELMRTVGGILDWAESRVARVLVSPEAAQIQTFHELGEPGHEAVTRWHLTRLDLRRESATRMAAMRGRVPLADPTAVDRHETRLRIVGVELGAQTGSYLEIVVSPQMLVVETSNGYSRTYTADDIAQQLQAAPYARQPAGVAEG